MKIYFKILLILLSFFLSIECYSGIEIVQTRYQEGDGKKDNANVLMQNNILVFNDLSNKASTIINLDKGIMTIVDHNQKAFIEATPEEFGKAAELYSQKVKSEMEKHLDSLPPEQQEVVKEMMKSNGMDLSDNKTKITISVKEVDDQKMIAGFNTKKYEIYKDEKLDEELWVSNQFGFDKEIDVKKMSKIFYRFKKVSKNFGQYQLVNEDLYIKIFEEGGFPLKTVEYGFGDAKYIEIVQTIIERNISSSELEIPKNYKQNTLDSLFKYN